MVGRQLSNGERALLLEALRGKNALDVKRVYLVLQMEDREWLLSHLSWRRRQTVEMVLSGENLIPSHSFTIKDPDRFVRAMVYGPSL